MQQVTKVPMQLNNIGINLAETKLEVLGVGHKAELSSISPMNAQELSNVTGR